MVSVLKFFDAYSLKARVFPAMTAGMPTLALLLAVVPWDRFELSQLIAGTMALILIWAFADAARQAGLRVESKLGSRSTTELWRHDNLEIDAISKARFRAFIADKLHVAAPTAETEQSDSQAANEFYIAAGAWLRANTRDTKKFNILFDELITYGARRNLLGLKPIALALNFVVLLLCLTALYFDWDHPSLSNLQDKLSIVLVAVVLHSIYVAFAVNKKAVIAASRTYGKQLILSCETLMQTVAAPSKRSRKTVATG